MFLHLYRFLKISYSYEAEFHPRIKEILIMIYKNIDVLRSDKYYSMALYRCLVLIDSHQKCPNVIDLLESYSQIFVDRYVFCLILFILLLLEGKMVTF